MANVDPYVVQIPQQLVDPDTGRPSVEMMAYFHYDNRWKHDIWIRSGGGSDSIEGLDQEVSDKGLSISMLFAEISRLKQQITDMQSEVIPSPPPNKIDHDDGRVYSIQAQLSKILNRIDAIEAQI